MNGMASAVHYPISTHLATVFGIGRIRFAPATIASLACMPLGWWIGLLLGWTGLLVAGGSLFLLGWWACGAHARRVGKTDPQECVLDEVAAQWVAMTAIPLVNGFFHWIPLVAVFVLFRVLDIAKPWPISRAEELPGGLGIMADDMIAGIVTAVLVYVAWLVNLYP